MAVAQAPPIRQQGIAFIKDKGVQHLGERTAAVEAAYAPSGLCAKNYMLKGIGQAY